ncbi:synaptophysin-like protein 2 [Bolinopsis microptera]|uniref:synaptophysin-like protein 2 n=1 Tax=Bolinopsis microptera TaxID=2820187 RepID=UPI00307AC532
MDVDRLNATKNEILAELHKDVFLTPKGMMKFVQLFVVICAFAMTTSAKGESTLLIKAAGKLKNDVEGVLVTKYPFSKYDWNHNYDNENESKDHAYKDMMFKDGFQSESQFYVFVGVMSFLYTLAAIISYAFYKKFEKMSDHFAIYFTKVDLISTVVLTFFWFLSTTLWSAGFSALRNDLNPPSDYVSLIARIRIEVGDDKVCENFSCLTTDSWSKLYGSVVFGYLCIFLYGVNCWYCFKDTEWHAEPEKLVGGVLQIRTDSAGPGPAADMQDVNLEVGGTDSATIQPGAI